MSPTEMIDKLRELYRLEAYHLKELNETQIEINAIRQQLINSLTNPKL